MVSGQLQSKQQFMKEHEGIQKKIEFRQKELEKIQRVELQRLVNEFDKKNYSSRYSTNHYVVLGALLGANTAEREIIRNGLNKNF